MGVSFLTASRFIDGKKDAIEIVYLEYKNLMYFIISNYVDNVDDCNDVLSDAFLKAIEHSKDIKNPSNLKSFLCSIAKNEAINFQKKNRLVPCSDVIEEIYGEEDRVNSVLNSLEPLLTNKETIILYYRAVFSYSWEEIVELTNIPESTARRIYSKVKEKLRKELL